jgi:hypothetical protein
MAGDRNLLTLTQLRLYVADRQGDRSLENSPPCAHSYGDQSAPQL